MLRRALPLRRDARRRAALLWWNERASVAADVAEFERLADTDPAAALRYARPGDLLAALRRGMDSRRPGALADAADGTAGPRARAGRTPPGVSAPWRAAARAILDVDPWREDAVRSLMRARNGMGDRAGAIAECAAFTARIAAELGIEPMPETLALRAELSRPRSLFAGPGRQERGAAFAAARDWAFDRFEGRGSRGSHAPRSGRSSPPASGARRGRRRALRRARRRSGLGTRRSGRCRRIRSIAGSIGSGARSGRLRELGDALGVGRPEDVVALPRVGGDEVRHVLDDAEDRLLQLMDEVRGFPDDHRRERLRHRHEDDAVDGERLQDGQRRIRGARRADRSADSRGRSRAPVRRTGG